MEKFVTISHVQVGKKYKVIKFKYGVRMTDIQLGETDMQNIKSEEVLGELVEIKFYGRQYDPDALFVFKNENGEKYEFFPSFGNIEGFVEL